MASNAGKSKEWLIIQDLRLFKLHNHIIHCEIDPQVVEESDSSLNIEAGDKIVYYACDSGLVAGLFRVDSVIDKAPSCICGLEMSEHNSFKIVPIKVPIISRLKWTYLDFMKLSQHEEEIAKLTPLLANPLSRTSKTNRILLNGAQFQIINQALSNKDYLVEMNGPTGWKLDPDLLCGILDFYNSRATSFVSLLVASVFGIVTLSAIIRVLEPSLQTTFGNVVLFSSAFLYVLFAGAGYYTLTSYSHYTGIADKVKELGINTPYLSELLSLRGLERSEKKLFEKDHFYKNVSLTEWIRKEDQKHSNFWIKWLIKRPLIFVSVYGVALLALAIITFSNYMQYLIATVIVLLLGAVMQPILNHFHKPKEETDYFV